MERPSSRLERLGLAVAAWLIRSVVRVLTRTWCIELRGDTVALDHLRSGDRAFVLSFWHDRSPLAANRDQAQILQEIVLPAEERTIEAAATP